MIIIFPNDTIMHKGKNTDFSVRKQVRKMYLIKTIKNDITKIIDVQAIVNAANKFLQDHPDKFDLVEWVLFDSHTESVYKAEVERIKKLCK